MSATSLTRSTDSRAIRAVRAPRRMRAQIGRSCRRRGPEDRVTELGGQIEAAPVPVDHVDNAQRVLVVAKAATEAPAQRLVERLLASVSERGMADVVADADCLGEILVQPERPSDRA